LRIAVSVLLLTSHQTIRFSAGADPAAYSDDVNGGFQRDVNKRSGDVNKVAERSDAGMGIMPETIDGNQGGE
jgi:hypothetical protein